MKETLLRYATLAALLLAIAWLVHDFSWHPAIVSIGLLVTYVKLDAHFSSFPDLAGRWQYSVETANREASHKGECVIQQAGRALRIQGTRRYTCTAAGGGGECREVAIPWNSNWAEVCADSALRFDYHIALPDNTHHGKMIEAICRLRLDTKKPSTMAGNYYMLPPFEESTLNCQWGTVTFTRMASHEKITPPNLNEEPVEIEV
jgi:hypothetical protein